MLFRSAVRAFRLTPDCPYRGVAALEAAALGNGARIFVLRIRRQNGSIEDARENSTLANGDIAVLAGQRGEA